MLSMEQILRIWVGHEKEFLMDPGDFIQGTEETAVDAEGARGQLCGGNES